MTETEALDEIADMLNESGRWSYDHLDSIANILRRTGREID